MSVGLGPSAVQLPGGGSVAASDITDSTATGRALLTGTAADGRTALGLGPASTLAVPTPMYVPLGVDPVGSTVDGTEGTVSVGGVAGEIDPADYAVTGLTLAWTLRVTAQVTSGVTLTVVLRNLTDLTDDATVSVTATTPTNHSAAATIAAGKVYELRASVSGGTVGDIGTIYSAALRATWS